jgi:hypothetical protein
MRLLAYALLGTISCLSLACEGVLDVGSGAPPASALPSSDASADQAGESSTTPPVPDSGRAQDADAGADVATPPPPFWFSFGPQSFTASKVTAKNEGGRWVIAAEAIDPTTNYVHVISVFVAQGSVSGKFDCDFAGFHSIAYAIDHGQGYVESFLATPMMACELTVAFDAATRKLQGTVHGFVSGKNATPLVDARWSDVVLPP